MSIEKLTAVMASVAESVKLPKYYKGDLEVDYKELPRYLERGLSVIWLLRSYGTVLVPIGIGVDPVYVTHWLWSSEDKNVMAFHITKDNVEKIDFETAEWLISREPKELSMLLSGREVQETVASVLKLGIELKIWGVFNNVKEEQFTSLKDWQNYFANSNHRMMANFIGKAMRFIKLKPSGQLLRDGT